MRAVNNNIIDIHHLKSLHSTIGSQVIKIVKDDEEGKLVVTFRDLNTHLEVPGYIHFDMEFDSVISVWDGNMSSLKSLMKLFRWVSDIDVVFIKNRV